MVFQNMVIMIVSDNDDDDDDDDKVDGSVTIETLMVGFFFVISE